MPGFVGISRIAVLGVLLGGVADVPVDGGLSPSPSGLALLGVRMGYLICLGWNKSQSVSVTHKCCVWGEWGDSDSSWPLPPFLHPGNPHRGFREQSRKQAGRNRALQPGTGGVHGNLCLIVLFMKLWEGFPVGFLMNWFVVDASNYSANGGSRLIIFPTSFQPPTIKHTNDALWAFPPSSPQSLTPYLLTEFLPLIFQECTWTDWVEGKGNWSPKLFFLSCWISVAHL